VNVALWIVQGLLALVYLAAGGLKAVRPREQLVASGNFDWMKDSSDAGVKAVGLVEILGALGVILPWLTGIASILTPDRRDRPGRRADRRAPGAPGPQRTPTVAGQRAPAAARRLRRGRPLPRLTPFLRT
jgi:hypothetical protein